MRIRRSASRLLGSAPAPALPGFELPPPSPPPPAEESHAGSVAVPGTSSPDLELCELNRSPWDLMAQLHPSDPQQEGLFFETYFVGVAWRTSWLFQPSMPAISVKQEDEELQDEADMAVDMMDGVIFELRVPARKKNEIQPRMKKVKAEGSDAGGGGAPVWACKKNDGKRWFCRRPVSQPNSLCAYHTEYYKPPAAGSSKPTRKRAAAYAGEGFYYYAGFGPSRSKRHRVASSSDTVPEPTPDGQKEEEAPPEEEKHTDSTAGQAEGDGANHQAEQPVQVEEPRCENTAGIAGYDEESSDDHDLVGDIKTKSPLKKRWRKPVKSRSLNSLM